MTVGLILFNFFERGLKNIHFHFSIFSKLNPLKRFVISYFNSLNNTEVGNYKRKQESKTKERKHALD